jgi:hypothetical protein
MLGGRETMSDKPQEKQSRRQLLAAAGAAGAGRIQAITAGAGLRKRSR